MYKKVKNNPKLNVIQFTIDPFTKKLIVQKEISIKNVITKIFCAPEDTSLALFESSSIINFPYTSKHSITTFCPLSLRLSEELLRFSFSCIRQKGQILFRYPSGINMHLIAISSLFFNNNFNFL